MRLEGVSIPTKAVTEKAILGKHAAMMSTSDINSQISEYFNSRIRLLTVWTTKTIAATAKIINSILNKRVIFFVLSADWRI